MVRRDIYLSPHTKAHNKANSFYRTESTVAFAAKYRHNIHHQHDSNRDLTPHNTSFYRAITKKVLSDFYPKYCKNCDDIAMDKEISTRPDVIRCKVCHYQVSRLSYTPLHHFKLPMWMFGYVFYESLIQFPKVLTATEISVRLHISGKAAALLKRRFQLFCSQQLPTYKKMAYDVLHKEFRDFALSPENSNIDISSEMANRPFVCADTAVLYSASERANKGRKRYRHGGATASIYLSEKLGGKQVGTLVQTIAVKNGPVFFTSVPNQKADTLGPIIKDHLPASTPLFTDQGYPWLWNIYKNHRSVNHNAKSVEGRYRWARNRWSKNGVHNQVAEGNQRLLKTAFASYGYIRPQNSTLYLNEFSFIKNARVFGLDALRPTSIQAPRTAPVRIGAKGYGLRRNTPSTKNWLSQSLRVFSYKVETNPISKESIQQNGFAPLNDSVSINKWSSILQREMEDHNKFWSNSDSSYPKRKRELQYQKSAHKVWDLIHFPNKNGKYYSVNEVCYALKLHKTTAMVILKKWLKLKLIEKRRSAQPWHDRRINFYIRPLKEKLPFLLYTKFRSKNKTSIQDDSNDK